MKNFRLNPNEKFVHKMIENIEKCDGMCPCAIVKDETTICPCDNFINNKHCQCGMFKPITKEEKDDIKNEG